MGEGAAEPSADGPWHGRSASFPASLDRYAGLTGPATKGRPQGTRGGADPTASLPRDRRTRNTKAAYAKFVTYAS